MSCLLLLLLLLDLESEIFLPLDFDAAGPEIEHISKF
jgi:hypothetical protein